MRSMNGKGFFERKGVVIKSVVVTKRLHVTVVGF